MAVQLRRYASTRAVPLVFAGGEEDQVARVRNLLPDAAYVSWQGVAGGLERAKALEKPVVPGTMDAYSQTELEPKLGVRDGTTLLLLGAPDGFGPPLKAAALARIGIAARYLKFLTWPALSGVHCRGLNVRISWPCWEALRTWRCVWNHSNHSGKSVRTSSCIA